MPVSVKPHRPLAVTVPSFAKLNLDLRVLNKRLDGYHEVRTVYQTISMHDELTIEFHKSKQIQLELDCPIDIEDNIIIRAARAVLEYLDAGAHVRFRLSKNIPLGAGLGGGSSNAAAVLLALPALAGKRLSAGVLHRLACWLGSDVPFFLYGGTALGLGRGTELYPLPDLGPVAGVVAPTDVHVSTAEAYGDLQRPVAASIDEYSVANALTSDNGLPILGEFQAVTWALGSGPPGEIDFQNDFEPAVLAKHPKLAEVAGRLRRAGAKPVRMTGSGSAFFGLTETPEKARQVARNIPGTVPIKFISRREYQRRWAKALGPAAPFCALSGQ